jgi:hypothetical protein
MHQYDVWTPFKRIAINITGPFPKSKRGNQYLMIAMDCFTKWLEVYAISNQEASVVEALVTNFFYSFGLPRELHSNFDS